MGTKPSISARRRQVYGLDATDYKVFYALQKGCCAICAKPKELHIDHDHKTMKVRGLLCMDCNTSIGKLGDNVEGLRRALAYLEQAQIDAGTSVG